MSKNNENNGTLPAATTFRVCGVTNDGDLIAEITDETLWVKKHKFAVGNNNKLHPALVEGDEFVGKIMKRHGGWYTKPLSRCGQNNGEPEKIYGILKMRDGKAWLKAAERNCRAVWSVDDCQGAAEGDFVSVVLTGDGRYKLARVLKNYGKFDLNKATASLILEKYGIPHEFDEAVSKELQNCPDFDGSCRLDLTSVPLVTIDGEDSKDFDDAIWAQKSDLGFQLMVAIADVSFYVRPLSELDREAYRRGNSVYLPNMVVPMLPEKLSNDLCSLNPNQKRASIVCLMEIDREGQLISYDFKRAVIRSAARLTYREVKEALDGKKSANITPVFKNVVQPIYEAYQALDKARRKRGALELETTEIKVKASKEGLIQSISKQEVYISHKIVEEFMIAANVAAALRLGESDLPVMYRVHDKPRAEKLTEIEPLLHNLGMKLPEVSAMQPQHFNKLISKCAQIGYAAGISDLVLRLQSQAQYRPENIGHFGLGLKNYVHFTSPIRRYADLLIHRALVKACELPEGGELEDTATISSFDDIGAHLCDAERRAVNAERDLTARFVSAYLEPCVGQEFEVKVTGIGQAGIFAAIESLGAEGLIPMNSLPSDIYRLPNGNLELCGDNSGLHLKMGDKFLAQLEEASPLTGGLLFKYRDPQDGYDYFAKGKHRFEAAAKKGEAKKKRAEKKKKVQDSAKTSKKQRKHKKPASKQVAEVAE